MLNACLLVYAERMIEILPEIEDLSKGHVCANTTFPNMTDNDIREYSVTTSVVWKLVSPQLIIGVLALQKVYQVFSMTPSCSNDKEERIRKQRLNHEVSQIT